jgi:hypothetical protein
MQATLYRIQYTKDGEFAYSQYARFASIADLEYEAKIHLSHFPGQEFTWSEAIVD